MHRCSEQFRMGADESGGGFWFPASCRGCRRCLGIEVQGPKKMLGHWREDIIEPTWWLSSVRTVGQEGKAGSI